MISYSVTSRKLILLVLSTAFAFVPASAWAHVKWFAPFDTSAEPRSLDIVLTPTFMLIAGTTIFTVFVMLWIDNLWLKRSSLIEGVYHYLNRELPELWAYKSLRYIMLIFFTSLFVIGGVILSPETKHNTLIIPAIQCVIVAALLFRITTPVAGICIIILWLYSAYLYGFFHMSDYLMFLGLAFYLMLGGQKERKIRELAYSVLVLTLSFSLLWAAIEKFVYPEWSFHILDDKPILLMGFSKEVFMNLAGFVEFGLAFLLITTTGAGFILTTLGFNAIFISAIFLFGKVDAIGHSPVIVTLFIMALWGPSQVNKALQKLHRSVAVNTLILEILFIVLLAGFFMLYYGIRLMWINTQ